MLEDQENVVQTIHLATDADVAWLVSQIEEPFQPNEKLADALQKYQEALK